MTTRPCIDCGDLIATGTRCSTCTPAETGRDKTSAHWNNARWKNLSKRLRAAQPFCDICAGTAHLQVDHILPIVDYPELTYEAENLRVLCRTCNGRRGATFTLAEATDVLNRLLSEQARTRKIKYRKLITVAQRAVQEGTRPPDQRVPPVGKARGPLLFDAEPSSGAECGGALRRRVGGWGPGHLECTACQDLERSDSVPTGTLVRPVDEVLARDTASVCFEGQLRHDWSLP